MLSDFEVEADLAICAVDKRGHECAIGDSMQYGCGDGADAKEADG